MRFMTFVITGLIVPAALPLGAQEPEGPPPVIDVHMRLRGHVQAGRVQGLGEITTQFLGLGPSDPAMEPYFALAEEDDLPVFIHMLILEADFLTEQQQRDILCGNAARFLRMEEGICR